MKAKNLELKSIEYHRNGISGVGFHVAIFIDHNPYGDGKSYTMLGILFDNVDECYCAVFNLKKLAAENITFGDNSYRGDYYEDAMRKWVVAHDNELTDKYTKEQTDKVKGE